MNTFESNIQEIFKKHGLKDDKLKSVVTDLFNEFESYMLRNRDLVRFIKESIDREEETKRRFR